MIYLENILLWDEARNPTRFPRITVDTTSLGIKALADWIVVGPYKIKILVQGDKEGLTFSDDKGTAVASARSGCIFVDDKMFEVEMVSGKAVAGGRVSGCFDVSWGG